MTSDRNYKTSLIIQDRTLLSPVDLPKPISRREFLHQSGATAIVLVGAPLALFNQSAVANPIFPWLALAGRAAAAAAISWLVKRVLNRSFPYFGNTPKAAEKLADELNLEKVSPRPTANRFHNRYASPYAVMNQKYHFDSDYSNKFGAYVQLNRYLRSGDDTPLANFKDLSLPEIERIALVEDCSGRILLPTSRRRQKHHSDYVGFRNTCKRYCLDPNHRRLKFEYVRYFNDQHHIIYPSYGVKINGRRHLLI